VAYEVHTSVFEGPFDLLLHLILEQKVELFDVRLADIVDAYLVELGKMQRCELEVATEFLLIAATLVELKTRRLLPNEDDPDLDDELQLWEQRDLLLARLLECMTFKDVAHVLERRAQEAGRCAPRTVGPDERFHDVTPDVLEGVSAEALRDAYLKATAPKPVPHVTLDHVTPVRTSVVDAIVEVADEVQRAGQVTFRSLVAGLVERVEMVVRFLAVLELVKQGVVEVDQATGNFGTIVVIWASEADVPVAELVTADAYEG
jgi:segregation and condensation protein A